MINKPIGSNPRDLTPGAVITADFATAWMRVGALRLDSLVALNISKTQHGPGTLIGCTVEVEAYLEAGQLERLNALDPTAPCDIHVQMEDIGYSFRGVITAMAVDCGVDRVVSVEMTIRSDGAVDCSPGFAASDNNLEAADQSGRTCLWTGAADGDWTNAANWANGIAPRSDAVCRTCDGTGTIRERMPCPDGIRGCLVDHWRTRGCPDCRPLVEAPVCSACGKDRYSCLCTGPICPAARRWWQDGMTWLALGGLATLLTALAWLLPRLGGR